MCGRRCTTVQLPLGESLTNTQTDRQTERPRYLCVARRCRRAGVPGRLEGDVRQPGAGKVHLPAAVRPSRRPRPPRRAAHAAARQDDSRRTGVHRARESTPRHATPTILHTHTHTFNGPFSGTTQVSRFQKGKTNLDFTEARDSEWQWHQLGHMQLI